jgi:hypothetical protein
VADLGSHARHDRFAIADALGGGAAPATIRVCPACGALHADLVDLQRALRDAWVPRRTRDLYLTLADANRLRRTGWRRLIASVGTRRDTITRPLALSLTGLGLAGLVLSTVPAVLPIGSASGAASAEHDRTTAAAGPGASTPTDPAAANTMTTDAPDTVGPPGPVAGFSIGLLGMAGAIFVARRAARRLDGVR